MTHNELEARAIAVLQGAGLVIRGGLDCSGEIARCGYEGDPRSSAGAYIAHLDFPPNVSFWNWKGEQERKTVRLYDKAEIDRLTPAERKALHERIAREAAAAKAATEKRHARVAARAMRIWASLPPADASNGYLARKGVPALGDVRQTKEGRLVLPLLDASGAIQSLQFIAAKGDKRFLTGGKTAGGYFPIPAKDGGQRWAIAHCRGLRNSG